MICWWQFGCCEGWVPESTIKSGWDVRTKLWIYEDTWGWTFISVSICIASNNMKDHVVWCNTNWDATFSTEIPSKVLVPWLYQCLSFALKSPIATTKYGLFSDNFSKVNSKLIQRKWQKIILSLTWRSIKNNKSLSLIFNSKFIYSFKKAYIGKS